MSCQICVEVCPFEAIKMDQDFELSNTDRFEGLLHQRERLSRSNEYYHRIHPTEASEVDERLAVEKARVEAKAKADAEAKVKAAAEAKAKATAPVVDGAAVPVQIPTAVASPAPPAS